MEFIRAVRSKIAATLVVILTFSAFAPLTLSAAVATPATYDVSRQAVSAAANHEITFLTSTGIDAPTDTITLSGYTGFGFGSVVFGDIDLLHGPVTGTETSEMLAAAPGVGVWGVTIAGTVITFTAPTDAALGEIAANDTVTIRIGLNATGGANQITNPASAGLAQITLGGTFGDSSQMAFPILTTDSVTVTATVSTTVPVIPPGGGGGSGDTVAPNISNIQVINITANSAIITWDTNESSNSSVAYGLDTSYASGTISDAGFVTSHSISLTGLSPGTVYHFRVSSSDAAANLATSGDNTFTTIGGLILPVISNVQVIDITDTQARVTWTTNVLANSVISYGTTTQYGLSASDPGLVTSHSLLLTGLTPNTLYHFFVQSTDQSANVATSPDSTFSTLTDATPPANVSAFTAIGGDAVVHLSWTPPPDPDYAGVRIVRSTVGYPTGPMDGTLIYVGTDSAFDDTQVINGVTYFYSAFAFDVSNNFASGALAQATPAGLPLPPTPENTNALCSNGLDDDANALIDCADPGCAQIAACLVPPTPQLPPVEPPTVPQPTPSGQVVIISPHFYGAQGTVELVPNAQGQFGAPAGQGVLVTVPLDGISVAPEQAFVTVGQSDFLLTLNGNGTAYTGSFVVPLGPSQIPVVVSMTFVGGGAAVSPFTLLIQFGGRIVEQGLFGDTTTGISGARVSLYAEQNGSWVLWNGAPYGQSNPMLTSEDGGFLFIVPNGQYQIAVEKDGYVAGSSPAQSVTRNVFGAIVGIIRMPEKPFIVSPTSTIAENISSFVTDAIQQAVFSGTVIRDFLQQPIAQEFVEVRVAPALIAVGLANLATALPVFNIFAYIQYLFTQPVLLLWRRKRQKYGVIYNSLTKQPVDLAIVRLQDAKTHVTLQTRITDRSGRFAFLTKVGAYMLDVVKPGYVFPSQLLKDQRTDVDYLDLYHGLTINAEKSDAVAVNIPIDPVVATERRWQVTVRKAFRSLQTNAAFVSVILSIGAIVISPSVPMALMVLVQVGVFVLFRRLSQTGKIKNWGIAFDAATHQPMDRTVVRIFDKKFNKLLETQITGSNGRYGFFVRRNVFYVTAEREGYEKYVSSDIDLSTKNEAIVDQNLPMKRKA